MFGWVFTYLIYTVYLISCEELKRVPATTSNAMIFPPDLAFSVWSGFCVVAYVIKTGTIVDCVSC